MFLALNFLVEPPPEFLDLHYQIDVDTDHVPKFCGDWLTELGDPVAD